MVGELSRGEVRWFRFQRPDKRRPVLILTRESGLEFLSDVTVAPITTTIRPMPTGVPLDRQDGMPWACMVNLDQIKTIPRARLGARITRLDTDRMRSVADAVEFALGLEG